MKKYILFLLVIVFTGCAPTYNIQPKYDKNTKSMLIDDYEIKNLQLIEEKKLIPFFVKGSISKYEQKNKNNNCFITHSTSKLWETAEDSRFEYYFIDSEKLIERKSLLYCDLTKLNGIKFFECKNKKLSLEKYFIDYESEGFKRKDMIEANKLCFTNIKDHFFKKAKKDKVKIKNLEIGNKNFSENSILYTGKAIYTYESKIRTKKKKTETYKIVIAMLNDKLKIFMKKYNSIRENNFIKSLDFNKNKLSDLIINERQIKGNIIDENFQIRIDASMTDNISNDFFPSLEKIY